METFESFKEVLYSVNDKSFDEIALKLFHFQAKHNPVYSEYIRHLGIKPSSIDHPEQIPFLPVSFFRTHEVKTGNWASQAVFTSSGTTGSVSSRHAIPDLRFYLDNAARCFSGFYGDVDGFVMLALLPSYVERGGSSLIAMLEDFIARGKSVEGGFFHHDHSGLLNALENVKKAGTKKPMIWGVTYALLDLADEQELDLSNCIIIETGGMKGRRMEITRNELHDYLGRRFHSARIHSEYGMTELMSQAYSAGNGLFRCPPWMEILLRDPEDPRDVARSRPRGGINVIDLANIHSCAFIETQDLGRMGASPAVSSANGRENGSFEVLGRMDNSDIRGCNLLVE